MKGIGNMMDCLPLSRTDADSAGELLHAPPSAAILTHNGDEQMMPKTPFSKSR